MSYERPQSVQVHLVPGLQYATTEEHAFGCLRGLAQLGLDFGQHQHVNGHLTAVRFMLQAMLAVQGSPRPHT